MKILLYSKKNCHLCDEAKNILRDFGVKFEEVDVTKDKKLYEKYKDLIPVLEINGREEFMGKIDRERLKRIVSL